MRVVRRRLVRRQPPDVAEADAAVRAGAAAPERRGVQRRPLLALRRIALHRPAGGGDHPRGRGRGGRGRVQGVPREARAPGLPRLTGGRGRRRQGAKQVEVFPPGMGSGNMCVCCSESGFVYLYVCVSSLHVHMQAVCESTYKPIIYCYKNYYYYYYDEGGERLLDLVGSKKLLIIWLHSLLVNKSAFL